MSQAVDTAFMFIKLLCLMFVFTAPAFAAEKIIYYRVGKLTIVFSRVEGFLVNSSCKDKPCQALRKGKEFQDAELPPELLTGGKNPRSVLCKQRMGGKVLIGVDQEGNQQSICWFDDNSYLI